MSTRPGTYTTDKARHDLELLAQLREQLGACMASQDDHAAGLAGELIELSRSWLGALKRDAASGGRGALADSAAAAIAASSAGLPDLERSLAGIDATLREIAEMFPPGAEALEPAAPIEMTAAVEEPQRRAETDAVADEATADAIDADPTPSPELATTQPLAEMSPSVPTFPVDPGATPAPAADAEPSAPTFPGGEPPLVLDLTPADASPITFPATADAAAAEPVIQAPAPSRFAEALTFPPDLDSRLAAPTPASEEPAPDALADAIAADAAAQAASEFDALPSLSRLARQLEEMCPAWGVQVDAGSMASEQFTEPAESAPEVAPIDLVPAPAPVEPVAFVTPAVVLAADAAPVVAPQSDVASLEQPSAAPASEPEPATEAPQSPAGSCLSLASAEADAVADVATASPSATIDEPMPPVLEQPPEPVDGVVAETPPELQPNAEVAPEVQAPAAATDAPVDASIDSMPADPAAVTELTPEQMAALMGAPMSPAAPDAPSFSGELTPEQMAALMAEGTPGGGDSWGSVPLQLPPERLESLQFLVSSVSDQFKGFRTLVWELSDQGSREDAAGLLNDFVRRLSELTGAFELWALAKLRDLLSEVSQSICAVPEGAVPETLIRVLAVGNLIEQGLRGLEVGMEVRWPLDTLTDRLRLLLRGGVLHQELQGWHAGSIERLLELDRVNESSNNPPAPPSDAAPPGTPFLSSSAWNHVFDRRKAAGDRRVPADAAADRRGYGQPTIRIPVASVTRMASMVSDLVATKNRLLDVIERLSRGTASAADIEHARAHGTDLARLTSGLDVTLTMMQVRLQNISHLFDRFPRVIRDVASIADKNVELKTDPGTVQVDKAMFDALSDPLGQLLRAVVTRNIERPAERREAGKPEAATIDLKAETKGTRVTITVSHDGRPTPRAEIVERAIELDMVTAERAGALSDAQALALEFDERYLDPELGPVGAKFAALRAEISVRLEQGRTTYLITAPLGVAVLDTVMVGVGAERYGIPLANVEEITQVGDGDLSSVRGRPVLRRRDGVVGVIDLGRTLGLQAPTPDADKSGARPTAVVIRTQHHRAALLVSRVLAKEELVVRSLGAEFASAKVFSGATISGDGRVNLIVDADRLTEHAHLDALAGE